MARVAFIARRPNPTRAVLALFVASSVLAAGCLSHEYRVSRPELERLASLPPHERGLRVRAVQQIGSRRGDAVIADERLARPVYLPPRVAAAAVAPMGPAPAGAPQPVYAEPPAPYGEPLPPDAVYVDGPVPQVNLQANVGVHVNVGPGPGSAGGGGAGSVGDRFAGPGPGAPPSGSGGVVGALGNTRPAPQPTTPPLMRTKAPPRAPSSGSSGGSSGTGDLTDDLRVLAIVVVAVAALAAVGLAATEGTRWDGLVAVDPDQPVHLAGNNGEVRTVPLSGLTPALAASSADATIADDEGWGVYLVDRAPLDRKGFAFKFELGTADVPIERYLTSGFASNIQVGYFPHHNFGLLGTLSLGFGKDDFDRDFFRNFFGAEAQAFLPGLSLLHLGGYANIGSNVVTADDGFARTRPALGLGGLLELEITTRFALMARVGYTFTDRGSGGWDASGVSFTAGLAIY